MHPYNLTEHEYRVLSLMARGYVNSEVSQRLKISRDIVKTYHNRICKKMGVANNIAALAKACRENIICVRPNEMSPAREFKISGCVLTRGDIK